MKKQHQPPRLADRLLEWYCDPELLDEVQGDLYELFQRRVEKYGAKKAGLLYWCNVLAFFHPDFVKIRKQHHTTNPAIMFKNYVSVAYRNLVNHKLYAMINVSGLMVSFAFCTLIWLYVKEELSFDRSYTHADQVYRAWVMEDYGPNEQLFNTVTPIPLGPALQTSFPEIKEAVRIGSFSSMVKKDDYTQNEVIFYADPTFFEVFDAKVLQGKTDLSSMQNLMLTQSYAVKYFGNHDPVGKTLSIKAGDQFQEFTVTGVVEDPPANVSLQYEMLIPFDNSKYFTSERARTNWYNVTVETYVLLQDQVAVQALEAKFPTMLKQVLGEKYKPGEYTVGLQPLTDIHLNADFPQGMVAVSDWKYIYILSGVALLILVVACINFVTLAVGRSITRAKEVGIRKAIGAERRQLMSQFWSEALLITLISTVLGIALATLMLPTFNQLADKELLIDPDPENIAFLSGLVLLVAFLAGSYPALILSGFSPLQVLRGKVSTGHSRETLRKLMVTFQFMLAAILITGTLVMKQQLQYLQHKNLGFDKEQIAVIQQNMEMRLSKGDLEKFLEESVQRKQHLENALARIPEVKTMTSSFFTFGQTGWMEIGYTSEDDQYREFNMNVVDHDFVDTYNLQLLQGRNFDAENAADFRSAVLINEAFAKAFDLQDPVGNPLPVPFQEYQVIGVLRDFHYQSLHNAVEPVVMVMHPDGIFSNLENIMFSDSPNPKISVKIQSQELPRTMTEIQQIWKETAPDQQFDFAFVDQTIDAQYRAEQRLGTILNITTGLGIFIACMGLFALVTLSMNRKTKEIGIRKVLGASVWQIVALTYKEFMGLIVVAFLIALPVSYMMMHRWLADFAYRINLKLPVFLIAGMIILLIASLTIAYQSLRAARTNPTESLRSE